MRKFVVISAVIITLLVLGMFAALEFKYYSLENNLREYLITVEGYSKSDILTIKAKLSAMPKFPVYVRFADDPDTEYIFTDRDASDWKQLDPKVPQRLKKLNHS